MAEWRGVAECVAGVGQDCQEPNNGVEALNTEYHFYVVASVVLVVAELPESSRWSARSVESIIFASALNAKSGVEDSAESGFK